MGCKQLTYNQDFLRLSLGKKKVAHQKKYKDYYPFGSTMPGRKFASADKYRFGFGGMEKDDEVSGEGNSYTTTWRGYDPRIGRWLSLDPLPKGMQSNYVFARDNPIIFIDPAGGDDYFYDKSANAVSVCRTGAPHKFWVRDGGNDRMATDEEVAELIYQNNNLFKDVMENASIGREQQLYFDIRLKRANKDGAKVMLATVAFPAATIVAVEAVMYVGASALLTELSLMMAKEGAKQFTLTLGLNVAEDLANGKGLSDINMLKTLKSIDGLDIAIGAVGDKYGIPGGLQALFSSLVNVTLEDGITTAFDGGEASEDAFIDYLVNSSIEAIGEKYDISTPSGHYAKTVIMEELKAVFKDALGKTGDAIKEMSKPSTPSGSSSNSSGNTSSSDKEIICFVAGTKILSNTGLISIENINKGDSVYSFNFNTNEIELQQVLFLNEKKVDSIVTVTTSNNILVESTLDHPYYIADKGWVNARDLILGSVLKSKDNKNIVSVKNIKKTYSINTSVYNFQVGNNQNYFVSKDLVLVHNKSYITDEEKLKTILFK